MHQNTHKAGLPKWTALALLISTLGGCTSPREEVMVERHVPGLFTRNTAEIGVIATGASHRTLMFRINESGLNPKGAFCAEPPPDAGEAIASSLEISALLKGPNALTGGTDASEAKADFARSISTALLALTRRSQGLQWARDLNASLCIDYLNSRINPQEYLVLKRRVMERSAELIKDELPVLEKIALGTLSVSPPPAKADKGASSGGNGGQSGQQPQQGNSPSGASPSGGNTTGTAKPGT
ncbi:MAG TPA: hypothetical protein VGE72_12835 [Azospirillum sp.]